MGDSGELLHLHPEPTGALLASARDCEAEVFGHWFGNTRAELEQEYAPYESTTTFLALADAAGRVLGSVRLIRPGPAGLKTLSDIGRPPWNVDGGRAARAAGMDLASTWEVATMGVRRRLGGGGVRHALALYHGLMLTARANQVTGTVAILDQRVRRLLDAVGISYPAIPGTGAAPYLGSPASVPVYAGFAAMLDRQRREHPESHRLVTLGVGMDGVVVPPLAEFVHSDRDARRRAG